MKVLGQPENCYLVFSKLPARTLEQIVSEETKSSILISSTFAFLGTDSILSYLERNPLKYLQSKKRVQKPEILLLKK
jgi:hypothetical protein